MTVTRVPSLEHARDLVPEHRAGGRAAELLDVGAAQTAGEYADELAGACRLGQLGELGQPVRVEDDRAHRRIVGGARGRLGSDLLVQVDLERDEAARLTESTVTSKGVIIVNYERAGAVPTGSL